MKINQSRSFIDFNKTQKKQRIAQNISPVRRIQKFSPNKSNSKIKTNHSKCVECYQKSKPLKIKNKISELLNQKNHKRPIYQRVNEILRQREANLQKSQQINHKKSESNFENDPTFRQIYNKKVDNKSSKKHNDQQYLKNTKIQGNNLCSRYQKLRNQLQNQYNQKQLVVKIKKYNQIKQMLAIFERSPSIRRFSVNQYLQQTSPISKQYQRKISPNQTKNQTEKLKKFSLNDKSSTQIQRTLYENNHQKNKYSGEQSNKFKYKIQQEDIKNLFQNKKDQIIHFLINLINQ